MGSTSLYRRWRSQTFADIIGQGHVSRTLQNALRTGRVSHAYLFCGSRGIGKTSAARVLAKAVNCPNNADGEPCNECSICTSITAGRCLDIIEIDAASNRGIDEIRDLREKVNFSPSEARYKFYILDEVHMLTNEAFNALLKTLEEPPPHAIFVLVTTEPHRLPATVLSRCQRFDFRRIGLKDMAERLGFICEQERIEAEPAALELVARLATGSLRDAASLLDQLTTYCGQRITLPDVQNVVGLTGSQSARDLVGAMVNQDMPAGLRLISQVAGDGADLRQLCREVIDCLRGMMIVKVGGSAVNLLEFPAETLQELKTMAERAPIEQIVHAIRGFSAAESGQRNTVHVQLPVELAFVDSALYASRHEQAERAHQLAPSAARPRPDPSAPAGTVPPASPRHVPSQASAAPSRDQRPDPSVAVRRDVSREGGPLPFNPALESVDSPIAARRDASRESGPPHDAAASRPSHSSPLCAPAPTAGSPASPPRSPTEHAADFSRTHAPASAVREGGEQRPPAVGPESKADVDEQPVAAARTQTDGRSDEPPEPGTLSAETEELRRRWPSILAACGAANKSIQALLRDCEPLEAQQEVVVLGFYYQFHRDAIESAKNRPVVEKVVGDVLGGKRLVKCVLTPRTKKTAQKSALDDPVVRAAVSLGGRIKRIEFNAPEST